MRRWIRSLTMTVAMVAAGLAFPRAEGPGRITAVASPARRVHDSRDEGARQLRARVSYSVTGSSDVFSAER
jgi:hypothetical protein